MLFRSTEHFACPECSTDPFILNSLVFEFLTLEKILTLKTIPLEQMEVLEISRFFKIGKLFDSRIVLDSIPGFRLLLTKKEDQAFSEFWNKPYTLKIWQDSELSNLAGIETPLNQIEIDLQENQLDGLGDALSQLELNCKGARDER